MRKLIVLALGLLSTEVFAVDSPEPVRHLATSSNVMVIYEPALPAEQSVIILPGFGRGFYQYEKVISYFLLRKFRVCLIIANSQFGKGMQPSDLEEAIDYFREQDPAQKISGRRIPMLAESVSSVWALEYLQTRRKTYDRLKGVVFLNPVLQTPIPAKESFQANSEPRMRSLPVHVRLGREDHFKDVSVEESAGIMRDLMRAFKRVQGRSLNGIRVPMIVVHDLRDPVLRGQENRALQYFVRQMSGNPIQILGDIHTNRADAHNLLHDLDFLDRLTGHDGAFGHSTGRLFSVRPHRRYAGLKPDRARSGCGGLMTLMTSLAVSGGAVPLSQPVTPAN